jgi:hypothetical protein
LRPLAGEHPGPSGARIVLVTGSVNYSTGSTIRGEAHAVFVSCGLVLMPGQNHKAIGTELLVLASAGAVTLLFGFRQAFEFGSQPSKQRLAIGTGIYVAEVIGAVILISGSLSGLYVAAVAIVVNVGFMMSAAWSLVVSVYTARMNN